MSPPQLTADTPVLDVFHPMAIGILELRRIEFNVILHHRFQGDLCEVLHLQEPLHRQLRFDRHIGTFGETDFIFISFHLFHQAGCFQVFFDLLTNVETVHADIQTTGFADRTVIIEYIDRGQIIFFAQHIVVHIVCRSHFQATGTELDIHIIILNHRDHAVYQRNNHFLPFQPSVLRIVRIDAHGRIPHDRFGTGCRNNRITPFRITFHLITKVIQFAMFFLIYNFFIGQGGQCFRIPVHHTDTAIDQSFLIEIDKNLDHAFGTQFVHRESRTVPITRRSQLTQLFKDDTSVLFLPFPSMFKKVFTCQVCLLNPLLCKAIHDFCFGCNRSVIRSRYPASVLPLHTGTADQNILDGIVKHVSHMKHASDVWGRNDDRIRLTAVWFRLEKAVIQPILIPLTLYFCGVVLTCNFHIVSLLFIFVQVQAKDANLFKLQKYKNNLDN